MTRAVAGAFAREGATVHLAGHMVAKVEQVAASIRQRGGAAKVAQVDAVDERVVDAHADELGCDQRTLDISMNLISTGDVQGTALVKTELADFGRPIHNAMRSPFVTARAAGRHMIRQYSGVMMFGGEGDPIGDHSGRPRPDPGGVVDHERTARGTAAGGSAGGRGFPDDTAWHPV